MLKSLLLTSAVGASLMFAAPSADAKIEDALANICAIVKADDKGELRKKMKKVQSDYSIKLRDYYDGITCGGNSLIRLAILNNAVEAGTLLVKKMPKKHLSKPEADGKTLQAWIAEQGLDTNAVAQVVADRI
ncbi:DUF3718 domain-containing protein [Glaciecola petra]|uniref:DUF3718 domain-containing protein n=1 Tax=Glaciecola petra TaxID=3075602 RepID=A0ABU2ZN72_9ALTE|nr:DUF3718 domain-containing protein [Aestuariibacter sp. P117]MDT0594077.1 DUF3718 domain-containing protein [Aestuariibacter sp. P117]